MLWLIAIVGILIGLIGLGATYQVIATNCDRRRFLPPGKSVDINGNALHYQVMGEGIFDYWGCPAQLGIKVAQEVRELMGYKL